MQRSLPYAAAALLACLYVFAPTAFAQSSTCADMSVPTGATCADEGEAKAQVAAMLRAKLVDRSIICWNPPSGKSISGYVTYSGPNPTCNGSYAYQAQRYWTNSCATRLDGEAGMINGTLYSGGVCNKGCKMVPNLDPATNFTLTDSANPNGIPIRRGTWKASGATCDTDLPAQPEKKDEYCHQSGTYTVCKSPDKTCITTASGFRTCASDAGNKTGHTATNNPRTEGVSISAPNTPANPPTNRPGENWQPSGSGGNITNNNGNTTNNYNYYNNKGEPNGNNPTPGDGSGPGQGGSNGNGGTPGEGGGEEGNGNSAGGGGDCKTPPTTSGDPILGMIASQTWATRCATEKGNSGTVTGDVGNCDAPFSVTGDSLQANQLRAQRAQLCRGGPGQGEGNNGNPHEGAEDVDGPGKWSWKFDESLIDKSGFGGGSCPQFGTVDFGRFGAVSLDSVTWWCPLVAAMRAVMLLLGAFISFRIVFGDGS
ncbi:hypothetical protein [Stenotrophomonas maltophilia]|uniref:hypothetical protein n=1 Tax=Stenotrophomonas maltophilia TaxID=40324 RepID=UPI0015C56728|nr:hypothetical protein [Stenotrophomonas maltophilia]